MVVSRCGEQTFPPHFPRSHCTLTFARFARKGRNTQWLGQTEPSPSLSKSQRPPTLDDTSSSCFQNSIWITFSDIYLTFPFTGVSWPTLRRYLARLISMFNVSPPNTHTHTNLQLYWSEDEFLWMKNGLNPTLSTSLHTKKNNPKEAEFALRVTEEWVVTQRGRGSKTNKIGMKAKQRADCVIEPRTTSLALKWWQFIYLLH